MSDVKKTNGASLCEAAETGDILAVKSLIQDGVNVNLKGSAGKWKWTPLTYAATWGRLEILKLLLFAKADPTIHDMRHPTAPTNTNCSAVDIAYAYQRYFDNQECIQLLNDYEAIAPAPNPPSNCLR